MKPVQEQDIEKLHVTTGSDRRTCAAALRAAAGNLEAAEKYIYRYFDIRITDVLFTSPSAVSVVTNPQQTRGAILALRYEERIGTFNGIPESRDIAGWAFRLATILCERGRDDFENYLFRTPGLHPFINAMLSGSKDTSGPKILFFDILEGDRIIAHHFRPFTRLEKRFNRAVRVDLPAAREAVLMALNKKVSDETLHFGGARLAERALRNAKEKTPDFKVVVEGNASVWPGMTQVSCLHNAFKTETLFDEKYDLYLQRPGAEVFVTDFRHADLWTWDDF